MKRAKTFFLMMMTLAALLLSANVYAVTKIGSTASITAGEYVLLPACAPSRALTIKGGSKGNGANAYLYANHAWTKQIFVISSAGSGTYTIRNKNSGKYLEIRGGSTSNKANIRQNAKSSANRQKWLIGKKGSYYVIQASYSSKKVMTVKQSKNANKVNVYSYDYYGAKGQLWKLVPYGETAAKLKAGSKTASSSLKALSGYTSSSRTWNDKKDYPILTNIIGAVESGGQVYGKRNYAAYVGPYTHSSLEHTITLGWAQFYGSEAQKLVSNILKKDAAAFKKIDSKGLIQKALKKNWVSAKWKPSAAEKAVLISLITSKAGKACQDALFQEQMKTKVAYCKKNYTSNAWAVQMYCEISHLGGAASAKRIFDRCNGNYALGMIMASLKQDQKDTSNSNQVGDTKFWSRHVKCAEFLQKYGK